MVRAGVLLGLWGQWVFGCVRRGSAPAGGTRIGRTRSPPWWMLDHFFVPFLFLDLGLFFIMRLLPDRTFSSLLSLCGYFSFSDKDAVA
jgi:hypothetical protein